jgi:hypothetical protein
MKILLRFVVIISFVLALGLMAPAKEWRGIVPLHSTRADVERLLGPSTDDPSNKGSYIRTYRTEEVIVLVLYSDTPLCTGYLLRGYRVPRWTVISITVRAASFPFSDLNLDSSKYVEMSGGHTPDFSYFTHVEEGVSYEVQWRSVAKGAGDKSRERIRFVNSVTYGPHAKDKHLLCPERPAPHNGTHPTRTNEDVIRKIESFQRPARASDAGRSASYLND